MIRSAETGRARRGSLLQQMLKGFAAGLVIAMMVVTGQLVVAEKGRSDPGLAGLLCVSGSLVMVELGEDGTPEGPAHVCPDALLLAIDQGTPETAFGGWQLAFDLGFAVTARLPTPTNNPAAPPPARGPPVLV